MPGTRFVPHPSALEDGFAATAIGTASDLQSLCGDRRFAVRCTGVDTIRRFNIVTIDLLGILEAHGISFVRHDHPPVFTCEEELRHVPESGAARTKNLFMRDRRGRRHLLLVTLCAKNVRIADFAEIAGADRLSFASPERLMKYLGVEPGSVSLLGLINDTAHAVELYVDADVWGAPRIHAHPLRNDATLVLSQDDVVRFLGATGHRPRIVTVR